MKQYGECLISRVENRIQYIELNEMIILKKTTKQT